MNTALVKPSKELKGSVSKIGEHLNAVTRARDIYQAGIKRLEAEYFERIKHASTIFTGPEEEPASVTPEAPNAAASDFQPVNAA